MFVGMMHGSMGAWMALWVVLAAAVVVAVVVAAVRLTADGGSRPERRSPRDELDMRYARGELSDDDYQGRRRRLKR